MATKKQQRKRAKNFRHDYDFVIEDDEGNEVTVDPTERRAERDKQRTGAKPARTQAKSGRASREPPEPSWPRAFRRGGMFGGAILLVFVFLLKNGPIGIRLLGGLVYAAAFIPLTYFADRTAYRMFHKRAARANEKKAKTKAV